MSPTEFIKENNLQSLMNLVINIRGNNPDYTPDEVLDALKEARGMAITFNRYVEEIVKGEKAKAACKCGHKGPRLPIKKNKI
jgi:hypothetical protein